MSRRIAEMRGSFSVSRDEQGLWHWTLNIVGTGRRIENSPYYDNATFADALRGLVQTIEEIGDSTIDSPLQARRLP